MRPLRGMPVASALRSCTVGALLSVCPHAPSGCGLHAARTSCVARLSARPPTAPLRSLCVVPTPAAPLARTPEPRMQRPASPPPPSPVIVDAPHPAGLGVEALQRDCQVTHTRGSGPGGQHRNKVSTAVVLKHKPTSITATASEARSQQQNLAAAYFRLRLRFALQLRTEPAAGPSDRWRARCKGGKLAVNEKHEDFPPLLAEALDHIWATQEVRSAAEALGISTSQMCKLLAKEPQAFAWVNSLRQSKGMPPLRAN